MKSFQAIVVAFILAILVGCQTTASKPDSKQSVTETIIIADYVCADGRWTTRGDDCLVTKKQCDNGEWILEAETCPYTVNADSTVKCWDSSHEEFPSNCPLVPATPSKTGTETLELEILEKAIECWDGSAVDDQALCPQWDPPTLEIYTCKDGRNVNRLFDCKSPEEKLADMGTQVCEEQGLNFDPETSSCIETANK